MVVSNCEKIHKSCQTGTQSAFSTTWMIIGRYIPISIDDDVMIEVATSLSGDGEAQTTRFVIKVLTSSSL